LGCSLRVKSLRAIVSPLQKRSDEPVFHATNQASNAGGHASPTTTRVYDRRRRKVTRNIVERMIAFRQG
jgi:hypothetical protein